jgi:glycosyltransferase involved in cell wall biosynthesis
VRIAHIAPVFPPIRGGMGTAAYQQARALAHLGAEVTVFTRRDARPASRPRGVEVVELPAVIIRGNAACLPQVLWRLQGYDLVHLHYPFFGTAELVAARRLVAGPPVVLQYQMDVVGRGWHAHAFRWHRRAIFPFILRAADGIVVTTTDYAASSFLGPQLASSDARLAVIPHGIDLTHLSPNGDGEVDRAQLGITRRPLIFFLAQLDRTHYFKGLHILFDALARIPEAALVVGGDGNMRREYESRAQALGLAERVHFAGDIPDEQLPTYYRAADVVVLPSVDRTEAFGLVLLEAMACGRPVVASRLPGVRTLVDEGRTGYLVEPGNAVDLAETIERCAAETTVLGAAARRVVEQRFNWDVIGQQLLNLYDGVITGRLRHRQVA